MDFPMDSSSIGMIVALVLLLFASAYFSATETAFSSLNKIRLRNKAEDGKRRAETTLALAEDFDRLLSTILVGNNIVNITAATLSTVLFTRFYPDYGATISTVVLTVAVLTFGEISPKTFAKSHAESVAMWVTPTLKAIIVVLRPLSALFSQLQRAIGKLFQSGEEVGITEDELITMVSTAEDEGGLDRNESRLIRSAIEFGDMQVDEILTPRVDMVSISDQATAGELNDLIAANHFSRIPVWHESIDTVIGIIHELDFHEAELEDDEPWLHLITPVIYVAASARIADLLHDMQRRKMHMAIVVDEFGGTEGLVTLEDILEELVGEIWDEHDEEEVFLRKLGPDAYAVDAAMDFDDFAAYFHLKTDSEMVSVSGWVMEQFGRVPEAGDSFTFDGLRVEVTRVENHRIEEIHVERETPKATA